MKIKSITVKNAETMPHSHHHPPLIGHTIQPHFGLDHVHTAYFLTIEMEDGSEYALNAPLLLLNDGEKKTKEG